MFGGNFAPRSWALCDGQLLPINQNQALFSILGTTFGGDGRTTFGLPDLRGRAPIHAGNGPGLSDRRLGAKGGVEQNVLNVTQLPSHDHTATVKYSNLATSPNPNGLLPSVAAGRGLTTPPTNVFVNMYGASHDANMSSSAVTVGNTGGNQAVNNMQPWIAVNYIIAVQGLFPSRN